MMQQFKNMNELVEYLGQLEERVKNLEKENSRLHAIQPKNEGVNKNQIVEYISQRIPQTNLLSPKFLTRAFAVWGHFFTAHFIISFTIIFVLSILYFCLIVVGLTSFINAIQS